MRDVIASRNFNGGDMMWYGTPSMRSELESQIKHYVDTFTQWAETSNKVWPYLTVIDVDTKQMMPATDDIILSQSGALQLRSCRSHPEDFFLGTGIDPVMKTVVSSPSRLSLSLPFDSNNVGLRSALGSTIVL